MSDLKNQKLKSSEINYATLDEEDLSPDEHEFYKKRSFKKEKRRVRRSALEVKIRYVLQVKMNCVYLHVLLLFNFLLFLKMY